MLRLLTIFTALAVSLSCPILVFSGNVKLFPTQLKNANVAATNAQIEQYIQDKTTQKRKEIITDARAAINET